MVEVDDGDRAAYHAAACIAANHVVALLGQVERVAASVGLDLESFLPLTRAAVDDVAVARGRRRADGPGPPGRLGHPQPPPRRAARGGAPGLPGRRGAGDPAGPRPTPPPAPADAGGGVGAAGRWTSSRPQPPAATLLDRARATGRRRRAGAHHGRAARRAHLARGPGPRRVRRGRGQHLREPAAVRRPRRHRAVPADARARPARVRRGRRRRRLRPARSARCTRPGPAPPATTVSVRGVSDRWEGASRPGHFDGVATVVAEAVLHRRPLPGLLRAEGLPAAGGRAPDGARPVAARRGGGVPDRAGGRRPGAVEPQRAALGGRAARPPSVLSRRAGRRPRRHRRRRALRRGRGRAMRGRRRRASRWCALDYAVAVDAGVARGGRRHRRRRARCACSSRPRWARSG